MTKKNKPASDGFLDFLDYIVERAYHRGYTDGYTVRKRQHKRNRPVWYGTYEGDFLSRSEPRKNSFLSTKKKQKQHD